MKNPDNLGCDDVLNLGAMKPMGYLPLPFFGRWTQLSIADVKSRISAAGFRCIDVSATECGIKGGALYAWSPLALVELLDHHADVLAKAGWPTDPERFVRRCAREWVDDDHLIRSVIADAFGNSWEVDPS